MYFVPAVDDLAEELKLEKAATDHLKSRLEMCLNSKKDTGSGNETGQLKSPPEKLANLKTDPDVFEARSLTSRDKVYVGGELR